MASSLQFEQTKSETFSDDYDKHFDADSYLKDQYSSPDGDREVNRFIYESLHHIFNEEGVSGDRLIDIGTGPCIYSFISSCTKFKEIIATDYVEGNRNALKRWLNNEPGCFDWKWFIERVCQLEGHRNIEEREQKIRETVKDVIYCDVHRPNPIGTGPVMEQYDCVITCFCLECAASSKEEYITCLKNVASLLKSGGTFVQSVAPMRFYLVGDKRFSAFFADEEFIKSALEQVGFVDVKCSFRKRDVHGAAKSRLDAEYTTINIAKKK
ncbi:indolethylamine N-methyltransferase-like isoform X1 [Glandiceps talaboti]